MLPFRLDKGDGFGFRQYYAVRGRPGALTAADVIHLSRLSYDGMSGMNPVLLHDNTLRRASLLGAYTRKYLESGTIIRGAIELPAGLDDDQSDIIVDRIKRYFRGVGAEQDIIVLPGNAKLNNAGVNPQQSQLVEQGTVTVKEIAMMTGVPPQFLYEAGEAKYVNTVEQAGIDVVRFTFRPWIEKTENQLSLKLLSRAERAAGLRINIDPDALLRGDMKAQADIGLAELKAGAITANEYRRRMGLAPNDDPEANKLKAIGDTAPKPAVPTAA